MSAAVRRLLASLTLLSVLFGTLGWAHPACVASASNESAMAAMAMDGSHDASDEPTSRRAGDETAGDREVDHGTDPRGVLPAGCATVAHCVVVAPAPSAVPAARSALLAELPRDVSAMLPRGPVLEPEFPPPRA